MQLINIGFGNIVSANRIIAIISPESAPIKGKEKNIVGAGDFVRSFFKLFFCD